MKFFPQSKRTVKYSPQFMTRCAGFVTALSFGLVFGLAFVARSGEYSSDLNSIQLLLDAISDDCDDIRTDLESDMPEVILEIQSVAQTAYTISGYLSNALDSSGGAFDVHLDPSQLNRIISTLGNIQTNMNSLATESTLRQCLTQLTGIRSYLTTTFVASIWDEFENRFTDGEGTIYTMPYSENYMDLGFYLSSPAGGSTWFSGAPVSTILQGSTYAIYKAITNLQISSSSESAIISSGFSNMVVSIRESSEVSSGISNLLGEVYTGSVPSVNTNDVPPDYETPSLPSLDAVGDLTSTFDNLLDGIQDIEITPDFGDNSGDPVFYFIRPENVFWDDSGDYGRNGVSIDFSQGQPRNFLTKCNNFLSGLIGFLTPLILFGAMFHEAKWFLNFFHDYY